MPSGSATPALPFPKVVWRLGAPVALARKGLRSLKAHGAGATWRRATERFALARSCRTFLSQPLFSDDELEEQRGHRSPEPLVVSVVVPLYNTDEGFLREMLASVTAQTYPLWELCLADGSDEAHAGVGRICRELASHDRRVRYQHLERNLGISGNSNEAIHMATGDYIALVILGRL